MRFTRRISVALSSVLLLQLSLLSAVSPCAHRHLGGEPGARRESVGSHVSMSEERAERAARLDGGAASDATELPCGDTSDRSPTDPCGASGIGGICTAMSSCSSVQSFVTSHRLEHLETPVTVAAAEPATLASGPASLPELPPPRV